MTPAPLLLQVSFNVDQVSGQLNWDIIPPARPSDGRHAGAILFLPGQKLHLQVTGHGDPQSGFVDFSIIECCLVTRPQLTQLGPNLPTLFSAPSPFIGVEGASLTLGESASFEQEPLSKLPDGSLRMIQYWTGELTVDQPLGRWEMSFLLTVAINRGNGQQLRVFTFDPESEVGDGSHPNEDGRPR